MALVVRRKTHNIKRHTGKAGTDYWGGPVRWVRGLDPWAGPMGWADGLRLFEVNIRSVPPKFCLCLRSAQYLTCDVCFLCKVLS